MTLAELVRVSEASRLRLTESHAHMKRALDVPARLKSSLMQKTGKWLTGSVAAGIAASFLLRKKKAAAKVQEPKRQRGFLVGLVLLIFRMGKPLAKVFVTKLLKDYLRAHLVSGSQRRFALGETRPY